MGMIETSPTTIAPLLLRNIITSLFVFADKSLLNLAQKYKLLQLLRSILASSFLFFLRFLPSFASLPKFDQHTDYYPLKPIPNKEAAYVPACVDGDSGIARALSQLLAIANDIPVSSRKYDVVRSLAETLIDDNHREDVEVLSQVNRTVLSSAFERTLCQLEAALKEKGADVEYDDSGSSRNGPGRNRLNRVLKAVRCVGEGTLARVGMGKGSVNRSGISIEKLAAELLWLAEKLVACGFEEEAVWRFASASNLAWFALSAEPRVQSSLVKVSAFLFKQAKDLGHEEVDDANKDQQRQTKKKMLMSWLPLLCRASIGTDAPVLSSRERAEMETVLTETIEMLEKEEEQEQVLSLWLHHFTYCPSSDWPNLHACYARWCTASRKLLTLR